MENEVKKEKLLEQYSAVVRADRYLEAKVSGSKRLKMLAYVIATLLLCPYRSERPTKVHIINGKNELRMANDVDYLNVYYGNSQKNLKGLREQATYMSFIKPSDRWKCLTAALATYHDQAKEGPLAFWLDFCFWNAFFNEAKPEIVLSNGHYDRLTTTLSVLCKDRGIPFYMRQHGFIPTETEIPQKVYCNRVYAYDETEVGYFRRNVIANEDCEYVLRYDFNVRFVKYERPDDCRVIGVIQTPFKNMKDILRAVLRYRKETDRVVVMLHPLTPAKEYAEFLRTDRLELTRDKLADPDVIVAPPSALVYDYVRAGYEGRILFVDVDHSRPSYRGKYPNVIYIDRMDDLEKELNQSAADNS